MLSFGILSKVPSGGNRSLFVGLDCKVGMMGARKLRDDLAYRIGTNDLYGVRKEGKTRIQAETGKNN